MNKTVDWDKIFYISPNMINETAAGRFHITKDKGKVINGDWDLPKNRTIFEHTEVYKAYYRRFKNGKSWDETRYYSVMLNRIESEKTTGGISTKDELDERFKSFDLLYENIKQNGFKTQRDLYPNSKYYTGEDEIAVAISRDGEALLVNGYHRLSVAKILGIKEIAVKVTVRHSDWVGFLKLNAARSKNKNLSEILRLEMY